MMMMIVTDNRHMLLTRWNFLISDWDLLAVEHQLSDYNHYEDAVNDEFVDTPPPPPGLIMAMTNDNCNSYLVKSIKMHRLRKSLTYIRYLLLNWFCISAAVQTSNIC